MKKVFLILLCIAFLFLAACGSLESTVSKNNTEDDLLEPPEQQSVFLKSKNQLIDWFKQTDVVHKSNGKYAELNGWKSSSRMILIPYLNQSELTTDIVIVPEAEEEATGIYYRHYAEEITCIIQVYPTDAENLQDISENLCRYRFGKKLTKQPEDATIGNVVIGDKEVKYGLSHSEAMERSFLTFLYADRYIITVGYMDTSTVELFDFLEKLSFQEVSLS